MPGDQNKPPEKLTEEEINEIVNPKDPIANQMNTQHQSPEVQNKQKEEIENSLPAYKYQEESRSTSRNRNYTGRSSNTVDGWMQDGKEFIKNGEKESEIDQDELKSTSDLLYNVFLGVGIVSAVIIGMMLGIKYMMGSIEEKADLKQTLMTYCIGCIVIFGAFGIWKLIVKIFSEM